MGFSGPKRVEAAETNNRLNIVVCIISGELTEELSRCDRSGNVLLVSSNPRSPDFLSKTSYNTF